jgi:hypothetical protein
MSTALLRLCGQRSAGPSAVVPQSNRRIREAISPSPKGQLRPSSVIGVEVSSLMLEMKIVGIEHRHVFQALQIENVQLPPLKFDQSVTPQFLKRPIDVNRGQPGRIRQIVLSQREIAPSVLGAPDRPQSQVELYQQVPEPLICRALAPG